eukprot:CAMPEP_0175862846 /NCGR_PEP_ID=MMETSP0107_2-20121207/32171_1 /TAXON_ID=195067 ORGANISM="Goniomonas pacifica, Strain CCMP1869" /NCGR_SAMPLE_ID=MMETSP0107_2 /ASSEMBLY_ACC=CAM_ASM_000203 /LENGTH=72 /DNA_ID=CAMNT_0017179889 /DNA_START=179 /DNA_END=397 /DNA_ORIENTATION=+
MSPRWWCTHVMQVEEVAMGSGTTVDAVFGSSVGESMRGMAEPARTEQNEAHHAMPWQVTMHASLSKNTQNTT